MDADMKPIIELAVFAQMDFNFSADYIWKAPTLIEALSEIEERKLKAFRDPHRARELRRMEQLKLKALFPTFVAQGSLFLVCSLLESYVLQLAAEVQEILKHSLDRAAGSGITKWLTYLRRIGVDTSGIFLWPQVDAALKIRNCLAHAQGAIQLSKDETEIRRIVKSRTFLKAEHRKRASTHPPVEVEIVKSALGDRLEITNGYSWLAASYLRDYFSDLCLATHTIVKAKSER